MAPALVSGSLTSLSVAYNNIVGDEARQLASVVIAKPALENFSGIPLTELRADSLTTLDLFDKGLGVPEAMVLADFLRSARGSLTSLSLGDNNLGDEGVEALSIGLKQSKNLAMLDLSNGSYGSTRFGSKGATALTSAIAVMGSLTQLDVRYNWLGEEGKAALRKAVEGRASLLM